MKDEKNLDDKSGLEKNNFSGESSGYHIPVLLNEVVEGLAIKPSGIYVDCTFGGGGHSRSILNRLNENGRLVAFDQDEDAQKNLTEDKRVLFIPQNFRHLQRFLRLHQIEKVDGVLADLGVSSHQFDEAERGFSTRFNAELDMRMDRRQLKSATDILNNYSEAQLHKLFEQFGEVSNSKTLAHTIIEVRKSTPIKTIDVFKSSLNPIVRGNPNKYFAQIFQALRIEVNDELNALKEMLEQLPVVLKEGGRAVIITFHSIEDRLVKIFFRDNQFEKEEFNPFATSEKKLTLRPVNKKPIVAKPDEIKKNPRSRSAKLRIAEKTV